VIKRHGFSGGNATHGSMFHRTPGSIGQSAYPSRVFPGIKLPGRMGGKRITVKNLQVVKINEEENLIYLRGAVPGAKNSYVALRPAKRG
jgi:large subunit ribosomal protein L3